MADKISKKELPADVLERIEHALEQDPKALSDVQIDLLMARRDYLTAAEKKQVGITPAAVKAWQKANGGGADEAPKKTAAKKTTKKTGKKK